MTSDPNTSGSESQQREPGLVDLLRGLVDDTRRLVRDEIALARTELGDKARHAARQSLVVGVGGILVAFAMFALLAAVTLGLAQLLALFMPREAALWLAPLTIGALAAMVGGILLWHGIRRLRADQLVPSKTIESMRESGRMLMDRFN